MDSRRHPGGMFRLDWKGAASEPALNEAEGCAPNRFDASRTPVRRALAVSVLRSVGLLLRGFRLLLLVLFGRALHVVLANVFHVRRDPPVVALRIGDAA